MATLNEQTVAPPCVMTIFGATGDLTKRLLLPSILNLVRAKALSDGFRLLGVAMEPWTDEQMRDHVVDSLNQFWGDDPDKELVQWLVARTFYQQANFDQPAAFDAVAARLQQMEAAGNQGTNRLFYLAVAPSFIAPITAQLARVKLLEETNECWRRLIIEKPFGEDLPSAIALNADLLKSLRDDQIYRIDHFAGKDAVQDIAVFRFSNAFVEPLWHRSLIDNVQITVAETVGVEHRAAYYEKSGALRDMVPNHLAELLSLVAMEPPVSFSAEHMRDKQVEALASVRKVRVEDVAECAVRAQYAAGTVGGVPAAGYLQEPGVDPKSQTETYVAMKVEIDNWRWAGVPFFLRTGKRMAADLTEIAVQFRQPPANLFPNNSKHAPNELVFNLKPTQGIHLNFGARAPGLETTVEAADMAYDFPDGPFGKHAKGYERLLHDAMLGNVILFQRAEFVEQGWRLVEPMIQAWYHGGASDPLPQYAAGTAGPHEADLLLEKSGHTWRSLGPGSTSPVDPAQSS